MKQTFFSSLVLLSGARHSEPLSISNSNEKRKMTSEIRSQLEPALTSTDDILDDLQAGERIRCMVALADCFGKRPVGNFRVLNSTSVMLTPISLVSGADDILSVHRFDNVFSAEESGSSVLAALIPFAMSCASGTDSSVVTLSSPSVTTTANSLFDRTSTKCGAVRMIEALAAECKKRHQQCYLSVGALDPKADGAVDLLASKLDEMFPVRVPFTPSIRDSNVFPQLQMHDVIVLKKPVDAIHRALMILTALEEHATVSRRCDVFAVVTVETRLPVVGGSGGEYTTRTSRLVLCDVNDWRRCDELHVKESVATSPFLGGDSALRLLAFGVGLGTRTAVLAAVAQVAAHDDRAFCTKLDRVRRTATFPVSSVSTTSSESSALFLCPEDEKLWHTTSALMATRQQLNSSVGNSTLEARCEQLGQDLEIARIALRDLRALLEEKLPLVHDAAAADREVQFVVDAKLGILREVEHEQRQRQQRLDAQSSMLLKLPVIEDGSGRATGMPLESRLKVIENVLELQQEENSRLRRMFERDVQLQQLELQRLRAIRESRSPQSSLLPLVEVFLEEAQLVFNSNAATSLTKFDSLVDQLAVELREQAGLILDGSLSKKVPTVDYTRMLFEAGLAKLRRSLGIEIPDDVSLLKPSSITSWESLVMHTFATRTERDRLRNAAAVMAQQATRTIACLQTVSDELATSELTKQQSSLLVLRMEKCRLVCDALCTLSEGQTDVFASFAAGGHDCLSDAAVGESLPLHFDVTSIHSDGLPKSPGDPQDALLSPTVVAPSAGNGAVRTVHLSLEDALRGMRVEAKEQEKLNTGESQKVVRVNKGHFSKITSAYKATAGKRPQQPQSPASSR